MIKEIARDAILVFAIGCTVCVIAMAAASVCAAIISLVFKVA